MAKKKQRLVYNYKKENSEIANKQEIIDLINKSTEMYLIQEAFYDDKTQSFTIQVHFNSEKV